MKYFSFLSLLVGAALMYYAVPYLKPNPLLIYPYPKIATGIYYFSVLVGILSIIFGLYSIKSILGWIRKAIRQRKNRSWYYEGDQMFLKRSRF